MCGARQALAATTRACTFTQRSMSIMAETLDMLPDPALLTMLLTLLAPPLLRAAAVYLTTLLLLPGAGDDALLSAGLLPELLLLLLLVLLLLLLLPCTTISTADSSCFRRGVATPGSGSTLTRLPASKPKAAFSVLILLWTSIPFVIMIFCYSYLVEVLHTFAPFARQTLLLLFHRGTTAGQQEQHPVACCGWRGVLCFPSITLLPQNICTYIATCRHSWH